MSKLSRRAFLKKSVTGTMAASVMFLPGPRMASGNSLEPEAVLLGKTNIKVSRLAWGTGTHGTKYHSNQTKLGIKAFAELAHHAFDAGINFFDAADMYGSHIYLRSALKDIPREKVVILTKMWTRPSEWMKTLSASQFLQTFLKELGTDYIDIVLLHCMVSPDWPTEMESFCEELFRAKEKGIIRAHGISCHSLDALQTAAQNDWTDVIFARINHTGLYMDDYPENVLPVLKQAKDRGAGVVGMKIFGNGKLVAEEERQKSLEFVWSSGNIHTMTIGFENPAQIDDTIQRINKILKG